MQECIIRLLQSHLNILNSSCHLGLPSHSVDGEHRDGLGHKRAQCGGDDAMEPASALQRTL